MSHMTKEDQEQGRRILEFRSRFAWKLFAEWSRLGFEFEHKKVHGQVLGLGSVLSAIRCRRHDVAEQLQDLIDAMPATREDAGMRP